MFIVGILAFLFGLYFRIYVFSVVVFFFALVGLNEARRALRRVIFIDGDVLVISTREWNNDDDQKGKLGGHSVDYLH